MGMLSDFFIADESTAENYVGGESVAEADKCQGKGISPLQAAQFLSVLRGEPYSVEMISEFELVTPEEAEDWTMRVPQDMVIALAQTQQDEVMPLSERLADATSEELGWSAEDFAPIVQQLIALAKRAKESSKSMYLWNCI